MRSNRRAISVRAMTYQRLHDFCAAHNKSVSGYIEELIAEHLDAANAPTPTEVEPPRKKAASPQTDAPPRRTSGEIDQIIRKHFTF